MVVMIMSRSNELYKMYEEEVNKVEKLTKDNRNLKLEIYTLKSDLKISENKAKKEVENTTKPLIEKINKLELELSKAYKEINRLKNCLDRNIQKMICIMLLVLKLKGKIPID